LVTVHDIVLYGGFIANIAAVGISIMLTFLVIYYQKKQTSSYEEFYKNETIKNLREIEFIFQEVDRISSIPHSTEPGVVEGVSYDLEKYFKQNLNRMTHIIQHIEMYLDKWTTLPPTHRNSVAEAALSLQWLMTDYYPRGKSFNTKKRTWPKQYKIMHEKAESIREAGRTVSAL